MAKKLKARRKSTRNEKVTEYPVIYSYIYEREADDIKRMSSHFRLKKTVKRIDSDKKVIVGFKNENGVIKPIFKEVKRRND